jgi:hypothetical protein
LRTILTTAICASALLIVGSAQAADIGANDDTGKYAAATSATYFEQMAALGLKQNVMTTRFQPSTPTTIYDRGSLEKAIPVAQKAGIKVTLAVYPYPPREIESGLATPQAFAAWLTLVAQAFPTVKQFVVMNEPNQPAFMRPQFGSSGTNASAARAGAFLAAGYDALKAIDPTIRVIGVGLSPRGNDRPTAPNNISTSPVRFLAALGKWYRTSGRTLPLMDGFSFHPYPNQATDPLGRGYAWPNAGFANLDRIKQALWDAFHDTSQTTPANGLRLYLDEVGWQVDTVGLLGYTGVENVSVTDSATQAAIYGGLVRAAACDPQIAEVNFFGFYDDGPRDTGFQSALHQVDGTPRASAESVRSAIAETASGCGSPVPPWTPTARVVGATVSSWRVVARRLISFEVSAAEGASVVACLLPGRLNAAAAATAMARRTASSAGCSAGTGLPLRPASFTFRRSAPLGPVTAAVRLVAETNAGRTTVFTHVVP